MGSHPVGVAHCQKDSWLVILFALLQEMPHLTLVLRFFIYKEVFSNNSSSEERGISIGLEIISLCYFLFHSCAVWLQGLSSWPGPGHIGHSPPAVA